MDGDSCEDYSQPEDCPDFPEGSSQCWLCHHNSYCGYDPPDEEAEEQNY